MKEKAVPPGRKYSELRFLARFFRLVALFGLAGLLAAPFFGQTESAASLALWCLGWIGVAILRTLAGLITLFIAIAEDQTRAANAAETTSWHIAQYQARAAKAAELTASYIERANTPPPDQP